MLLESEMFCEISFDEMDDYAEVKTNMPSVCDKLDGLMMSGFDVEIISHSEWETVYSIPKEYVRFVP